MTAVATTLTLPEVLAKINSGNATASDYEELAKLSKKEADSLKQVEGNIKALIKTIKDAKIDAKVLTQYLLADGLIELPKQLKAAKKAKNSGGKEVLYETAIKTKSGRDGTFKIWKGRNLKALVNDAKGYWTDIKAKGKDAFIAGLTDDGKAYYATADGKAWVESLFAAK
jgi:DNA-binding FrmR family transcriptional regulator